MKNYNNTLIIGIDHGYGNIKTANCCFNTGVTAYEKEPTFKENLLIWDYKYYLIGEEHKEFSADKMLDLDYYVLTLAAIARELNIAKTCTADVFIAAGLPLTWVSQQKEEFKKYLLQFDNELRAIGNNMHQIYYKACSQGFIDAPMYKENAEKVHAACMLLENLRVPVKIIDVINKKTKNFRRMEE